MREGKKGGQRRQGKGGSLKGVIEELVEKLKDAEERIEQLLVTIPNLPHESVPEGKSAEDNLVERSGGVMPSLLEGALPHWDLAKQYDLIDFELGVKITGAGFPVYKGKGARLQRALINFFLDSARARFPGGSTALRGEQRPGFGTGQLPDRRADGSYRAGRLYSSPHRRCR